MNSPGLGLRVASVIFGLVGLGHLLRVVRPFQVMLGSHSIPVWLSGVAFIVAGALCFWFWKLACMAAGPEPKASVSGGSTLPPGAPAAHA